MLTVAAANVSDNAVRIAIRGNDLRICVTSGALRKRVRDSIVPPIESRVRDSIIPCLRGDPLPPKGCSRPSSKGYGKRVGQSVSRLLRRLARHRRNTRFALFRPTRDSTRDTLQIAPKSRPGPCRLTLVQKCVHSLAEIIALIAAEDEISIGLEGIFRLQT